MKVKLNICIAAVALLTLAGCSKDRSCNPSPMGNAATTVYAVGSVYVDPVYASSFSYSHTNATYWENGVRNTLSTDPSAALAIAVSGKDVYIVGFVKDGQQEIACYWKNKTLVKLSDGTANARANGIVVVGNDVYITGNQANMPVYWKNGVITQLQTTGYTVYRSNANGISVSGNDIYITGNCSMTIRASTLRACYWKNGVFTYLLNPTATDQAHAAIAVKGNDVYVAGWNIAAGAAIPALWKNDVSAVLPVQQRFPDSFNIFLADNDVYVIGNSVPVLSAPQGMYWKNGVYNQLPQPSMLRGVTKKGADIYFAGEEYINKNPSSTSSPYYAPFAAYWKNGVITRLADTNTPSAVTATALVQ